MTAQILKFNGITKGDVPVADVLKHAAHLENVIVLGWTKDGEFYAASSTGDMKEILWLVEKFKLGVVNDSIGAEE